MVGLLELGIGAAVMFIALVLKAAVKVPTLNYGIVLRFSRRTGRVLDEGLNFVLPFIDEVELYPYEVATVWVDGSFYCKDRLKVMVKAAVRWKPNLRQLSTIFIENARGDISDDLANTVKSCLGSIAGVSNALDFVHSWDGVGRLLNATLKSRVPPHVQQAVPLERRLAFYESQSGDVLALSEKERQLTRDRSEAENRHGIDILTSIVSELEFTEESRKALEIRGQTEMQLEASTLSHAKKIEMMEKLKEAGLDSQAAVDSAEATLGHSKKQSFSVTGLDKFKPFGKFTGGNDGNK